MASKIEHGGTVISIEGNTVVVEMIVEAACQGCKMKAMCNKESEQNRVVSVYTDMAAHYSVHEHVIVSISTAMGVKAAVWVYVIPFLIVLATLVGSLQAGATELTAGLSSLIILAVYYFLLYLLKEKIEKQIVFEISKP